jgi:hypothetical protein
MPADSAPGSFVLFLVSVSRRHIRQNRERQSTVDTKRPAHVLDLTGTASQRSRQIVGLAVEVVFHQLDAFVEAVADLDVVVDPVHLVFRHEYLLEIVEELWLSAGKFATPQNVIVPNHSYTTMKQSFPTLPQTPVW